jgi:DNA-binding YbaB/EbfC family protein
MTNTPDDHQPMVPDVVSDPESGNMGGFDLGGLLEQAAGLQQQMLQAQERANAEEVEGVAGGGVVKVRVNGGMEFLSVTIDPDVVDPADVEMLQDLVLAALHDAVSRVQELQAGSVGGIDLGGMDLGGLLGGAG